MIKSDLKTNLANARELVDPLFSEMMDANIYEFARSVASVMEDEVTPQSTVEAITKVLERTHTDAKKVDKVLLPIDELTEDEFYQGVSTLCLERFGWEVPRIWDLYGYIGRKLPPIFADDEYPSNIKSAVEWWASTVQKETDCTPDELRTFNAALANRLAKILCTNGIAYLKADYKVSKILCISAEMAGIEDKMLSKVFSSEPFMYVTNGEVRLKTYNKSTFDVLYTAS